MTDEKPEKIDKRRLRKGTTMLDEQKVKIAASMKGKSKPARHREAIRVGMLIKRLQDHVEEGCDMTPTQIRAAEILLKKTLPDLQAVSVTGEDGGPVRHQISATMDNATATKLYQEMVQGDGA